MVKFIDVNIKYPNRNYFHIIFYKFGPMKRYGSVIRVRPEKLEEYKRLHAEVWPGVRKMIAECGLRNYSIYYKDGYLFSY